MCGESEVRAAEAGLLKGVRICLVFEYSLLHSSRYRQEIRALQDAGASIVWLTSCEGDEEPPPDLERIIVPRLAESAVSTKVPPSSLSWRPLRIADNLVRRALRAVWFRLEDRGRDRANELRRLANEVDLFWVSDYLSLPAVMRAARGTCARVVYETVDLVPEYRYEGERVSRRRLADEGRLISKIDGFVTASDSYADYYMERYGQRGLKERPTVRNNMPPTILNEIRPTSRPLRVLFLGALMFDRPILELMEAISLTSADVTLTFQGPNRIGNDPERWMNELGVADRVQVLAATDPDNIVEAARRYDVGIVSLRGENENERRASTSKLFTYMAAGLAVVGSNLPGVARVVNEHRIGILVDGMAPAAWASALERIALMSDMEIDALKRRSLAAAHQYAWESERPAFVAEFVRALGRREECS